MTDAASTVRIPILHANDVYRVRQKMAAPDGTQKLFYADQFVSRAHAVRDKWPGASSGNKDDLPGLALFSGDVFNPSVESSITRGEHMVCIMNAMKWDCSTSGNHDFDFGLRHLQHLMGETNFPWVLSNVVDTSGSGKLKLHSELGQGVTQVEQTLPWWTCTVQGVKVGIVGLVEKDWIATIPSFPPECKYVDMVKVAKMYSSLLRTEHACELVIALTHSRLPNDLKLALATGCVRSSERPAEQQGTHLDLILGGHDHFYYSGKGFDSFSGPEFETQAGSESDTNAMILKSGTDFRDLSEIWLEVGVAADAPQGTPRAILKADVERIQPNPVDDSRFPGLDKEIDELLAKISKATDQAIAMTLTPWDCRSEKLRTEETGIGNFIADICLRAYDENLSQNCPQNKPDRRQVDCALLCGGAVRSDTLFPPGSRSIGDILEILPFDDAVVVIELDGKHLLEALESGLSKYPEQEGRFPILGGLAVKWDSKQEPGHRVLSAHLLNDGHLFSEPDHAPGEADSVKVAYCLAPKTEATSMSGFGAKWTVYNSALELGPEIDPEETYRVVSREYMVQGYDGFEALTKGKTLIDDENGGLMMSQLVRKYLLGCSYLLRMRGLRAKYGETPAASQAPSVVASRTSTPATPATPASSAPLTPQNSSLSLTAKTSGASGTSTKDPEGLAPVRPVFKDAKGHLRVLDPASVPHQSSASTPSLAPSAAEDNTVRSSARSTSPRQHHHHHHHPQPHHHHHHNHAHHLLNRHHPKDQDESSTDGSHRHHLHHRHQPHRPHTPHHGFPVTSRARQALERWLHLAPTTLDQQAYPLASAATAGPSSDAPTSPIKKKDDGRRSPSPLRVGRSRSPPELRPESSSRSRSRSPGPESGSHPKSRSRSELHESGKELWATLRQAVVDNSSSGMRHALYLADAEEHDDPVSGWFSIRGMGRQHSPLLPPQEEGKSKGEEEEEAGDTDVLTKSVSLDQGAVNDLNDHLVADSQRNDGQTNLAVVAPLIDGRLLDVARPPPDLGDRHRVQEHEA